MTSTRAGDAWRPWVVLVSSILAIAAAFVGSGVTVGTPIQDAAGGFLDSDSTLLAPGTGAFRIWSVIYTGMLAYAVWQALPAQRTDPRHRALGWWVTASLVLNAVWILVVQAGLLALSLVVIAALVAVLGRSFQILRRSAPRGLVDTIVTDGAIGLYLGWVMIATVANATAVLVAAGFAGFGLAPEVWAVAVLAVAAALGVLLAVRGQGRLAPAISLSWGIVWIAVARLTDEPASDVTGVAAIVASAVVVGMTLAARGVAVARAARA
ncbi:TspO/MBR family protein [Microbacterium excoecariae]|uniref:TspO/MBR family protein n=1 Tax=Microbacterium excoecariae TaxID=2715210 RepID=UPI001409C24C|nr:TspO/MBR family protein [Microbacterium excoecariae]NHI15640.1 tryptophan-rich sensory protein [Microbacterium excoecariae]